MSGIAHMIDQMIQQQQTKYGAELTTENFVIWEKGYVFNALKNQRYGQDFCNHFGITDNILFYETDPTRARAYIKKQYLS